MAAGGALGEGVPPVVVARRRRTQVMGVLGLAASFEEQGEYQRRAPVVDVPGEVIHRLEDWVAFAPDGTPRVEHGNGVWSREEIEALRRHHAVRGAVADETPRHPDLEALIATEPWDRPRTAAAAALAVFERRGAPGDDGRPPAERGR